MNYIICTVQRSGKTWLCRTLRELSCFGWPEEYVNFVHKGVDSKTGDCSLLSAFKNFGIGGIIDFVRTLTKEKTGQCHTVGLALQRNQLSFLSRSLSQSEKALFFTFLGEMNPRIYYLKRRNVLQQAISLYISSATGIAHSFQAKDCKLQDRAIPFDPEAIRTHYEFCKKSYAKWDKLFREGGINAEVIYYEELCRDICPVIRRLADNITNGRQLDNAVIREAAGHMSKVGGEMDNSFRQRIDELVTSGAFQL